ncbi:DUF4294 domain-containing protein [Myroides marinus]|uniref:DUF4294 domain-containing protein n=1 Tax=Myroides marinus TaxID=703342 RepID=A0A163ZIP4_9FLAO|nr:DUF4294 domain-containing protein [Myroides marinus]KUF38238.1 hypothetical protein AS361_08315 [Myroides marinus]KZE81838.1 hypothetical protein AV926_00585 [Myroides marinus]MDM1347765.1 DUF4294 domain-containing protein [Myroides marinus]MDM1351425.1 DUF4294 domain-containing protein [Myroides marinus]MDM1355065.1 DUF4294 domain-containing protein [Myroides marinus]
MKKLLLFSFLLLAQLLIAQEEKGLVAVPEIPHEIIINGDTIQEYTIPEIFIGVDVKDEKYRRDMIILRNRLRRVYPYAKATAENLVILNANLDKMSSSGDKRRYIKRSQKYLEEQFTEKLKKLSRNDGKILIKLIDRQTGQTVFKLIKEFKSGWKAFWSNTAARTFSLNLKSEYHPESELDDFYIEVQLQYLFYSNQLEERAPHKPINLNQLRKQWSSKIGEDEFFPSELRE